MKRAASYVRVSTVRQGKGFSKQEQIRACERYAEEHGYTIVETFEDKQTGADMERPGWDALLAAIKPLRIDVVLVDVMDRLARGMAVQLVFEEEVTRRDARIEYASEYYEDSDEGKLQKHVKAAIAEYERAKIKRRAKQGRMGKAREGYVVVTTPPYGYSVVSEPKKTRFVVNEDEAKIVRMVFQWYAYGDETSGRLSIRGIARKLNEMGVKTKRDALGEKNPNSETWVWRPRVIHRMLTSQTYIGKWHYNKTTTNTSEGRRNRRDNDPSDWIEVKVAPIISQELFDLVQEQLQENKERAGRRPKRAYLLAGMLRCLKCHKRYSGNTWMYRYKGAERPIVYYRCAGHHVLQPKICDMPEFAGADLEDVVWKWLSSIVTQPEQIGKMLRARQADIQRLNTPLLERLTTIEGLQSEKHAERGRLMMMYQRGNVPLDLVEPSILQLTKEIDDLERSKATLSDRLAKLVYSDDQISSIERACAEVGQVEKGLHLFTFEEKRRYLERFRFQAELAIEDGEKVAYVSCVFGEDRLPLYPSSEDGSASPKDSHNCNRQHVGRPVRNDAASAAGHCRCRHQRRSGPRPGIRSRARWTTGRARGHSQSAPARRRAHSHDSRDPHRRPPRGATAGHRQCIGLVLHRRRGAQYLGSTAGRPPVCARLPACAVCHHGQSVCADPYSTVLPGNRACKHHRLGTHNHRLSHGHYDSTVGTHQRPLGLLAGAAYHGDRRRHRAGRPGTERFVAELCRCALPARSGAGRRERHGDRLDRAAHRPGAPCRCAQLFALAGAALVVSRPARRHGCCPHQYPGSVYLWRAADDRRRRAEYHAPAPAHGARGSRGRRRGASLKQDVTIFSCYSPSLRPNASRIAARCKRWNVCASFSGVWGWRFFSHHCTSAIRAPAR